MTKPAAVLARHRLRVVIAGALLSVAPLALGDTLVTKDGRHFTGEVTKLDNEYVVKTKFGEVHVSVYDFDHLDKGAATPAPAATSIPAHPATPSAKTPGTTAGKRAMDPKTLEALLKQAHDALAAGEYKAARDAYSDAAAGADKNVEAEHGLALAYMYLNDFAHSREPMEKAMQSAGPAASRALVLNQCVCQIGLKNPMRGAKAVMDYLSSHSTAELDEPMLNAMGTALNVADAQAKKGGLFQQCTTFYVAYNAKVEAKVPGYKRWGTQWEPAADVDRKNANNDRVNKEMARLEGEINDAERPMGALQQTIDQLPQYIKRGHRTMDDLQRAQSQMQDLINRRDKAQKAWDAEAAKLDPQPFPRTMTLVAMDDLTPPAIAGNTAVASAQASPLFPELTKPKPPKRVTPKKTTETNTSTTGGGTTTTPPVEEPPQIAIAAQPAPKKNVRITSYAAAFPVGDDLVLTTAAAVARATELTIQTSDGTPLKAELVRADEAAGLALLRVTERKFVPMSLAPNFPGGSVLCPGYPVINIFNPVAESITGIAKAPGADWKIALNRNPRLGGSPLVANNKVVGVELATRDADPANIPAATLEQVRQFLGSDAAPASNSSPDPIAAVLQVIAVRESSAE